MLKANAGKKIWFIILCGIVFAYASLFTGFSYLFLEKVALGFCIIVAIGAMIEQKMELDIALLFLFQAMFVMSLKDDMAMQRYDVCYGWLFVSAYLLGKMLVGNDDKKASKRFVIGYYALGLGLITTGLVDVIYNHTIGYYSTEFFRSIWTGETTARTVYELFGLLIVASGSYLLLEIKNNKCLAILGLCLAVAYVILMVVHEGRYSLFIAVLLVPMTFCIYMYENWESISVTKKRRIVTVLLCLLSVVILSLLMFILNIFGLKDIYHKSYLSDGGILHNIRFQLAAQAILNIPGHWQGGYSDGLIFNAHNSWLEFGNKYGVIVYVLLSCFRFIVILDAIKLLIKKNTIGNIKYLIIPGFLFVNIYFSMEPVGFRRRHYFVIPLIIFGMVRRYRELQDNKACER